MCFISRPEKQEDTKIDATNDIKREPELVEGKKLYAFLEIKE